jgi:hypothetical protein
MDYAIRGSFVSLPSAFTGGAFEAAFADRVVVVGGTFVGPLGDAKAGECQPPG